MAEGYTAYMTYMLVSETGTTNGYGYSDAIHCNYINKVIFNNLSNKEFNIYFESQDEFKFLSNSGGTGFTAHKIYVIAQLIDNESYTSTDDVKPASNEWKIFDVTEQVTGYTSGQTLTSQQLTSTVFRVPVNLYNLAPYYDLDYLDYPLSGNTDLLCFGDETYFLGNVETSIEAIAYSTDLAINLPLNQFNSTTNPTWDQQSEVYITEIGLYDNNKNLVGIAKLNNPIPKDSTIARTIVFGMDF
ncbi:MAG: hypothetical protein ACOC33_01110 [bacterium]